MYPAGFVFLIVFSLCHLSLAVVAQEKREKTEWSEGGTKDEADAGLLKEEWDYQMELEALRSQFGRAKLDLIGGRVRIAELESSIMEEEDQGRVLELDQELVRVRQREVKMKARFEAIKEQLELYERMEGLSREALRLKLAELQRRNEHGGRVEENADAGKYVHYRKENDVMYEPPSKPCTFAFEGSVVTTGYYRKDTRSSLLFSYTDVQLEPYFPKRDFITCEGFITAVKGLKILHLDIAVATPKTPGIYGAMMRGLTLQVYMLSGETVRLINQVGDAGEWDPVRQVYYYRCQYPIGIREERLLERSEADSIKVEWSGVSDKFEVFDVDFFKHHIGCLNGIYD